jgi:hypothetical protein
VVNADVALSRAQVTNNGLLGWGQGDVVLGAAAKITNNGTVQAISNKTLGGTGTFENNGVRYVQGAGGTIFATSGAITFSNDSEFSSQVIVSPGAEVVFNGGTDLLLDGTTFLGAGTVSVIQGASFQILGGALVSISPTFILDVGDPLDGVNGMGTLDVTGPFTWGQGQILQLQALNTYGATTLEGGQPHILDGTTLNQYGTATWQDGGDIRFNYAIWANYGSFDIQNNALMRRLDPDNDNVSAFENRVSVGWRGLVTKSVLTPVGFAETNLDLPFRTWGDVRLLMGSCVTFGRGFEQNGATSETELDGGQLRLGSNMPFLLNQGTLDGYGTIGGWLWNVGGTVWVGNASGTTLGVTGAYVQQSSASLMFYAANANTWGLLAVAGNAELDGGNLFIDLAPGYAPPGGFRARVLTTGGAISGGVQGQGGFTVVPGNNFIDVQA